MYYLLKDGRIFDSNSPDVYAFSRDDVDYLKVTGEPEREIEDKSERIIDLRRPMDLIEIAGKCFTIHHADNVKDTNRHVKIYRSEFREYYLHQRDVDAIWKRVGDNVMQRYAVPKKEVLDNE